MDTQEKKKKLKRVVITIEKTSEGTTLGLHLKGGVGKIEAGAMLTWAKDKLVEEIKKDSKSVADEIGQVLANALDRAMSSEAEEAVKNLKKLAKKMAKKAEKKSAEKKADNEL